MAGRVEKILVISTMYPSRVNPTFGIFVKNQVTELRNSGFKVDILAIKDPRVKMLQLLKKYLVWFLNTFFILLVKGRQYDIIHAHYIFPSGQLALLFKKLFGTRVIVTAHGGDIDKMSRKGAFFWNRTKKILQKADHVIAVGEKLKGDIVTEFQVKDSKVSVLNMGVNRKVFSPMDKCKARSFLGLPSSAMIILFSGNIIKAKGVLELVEAYRVLKKKFHQLQLHIVGPQKDPEFIKTINTFIADHTLEGVAIHPPVDQVNLSRWFSAADIFVLPSHMEGFGLVALEAMSCNTPVVGTNVGGLRSLIAEGAGVIVEPKSIDALYDGIESIIKNDNLRQRLIAKGEEQAQLYNHNKVIKQLINIYHQE